MKRWDLLIGSVFIRDLYAERAAVLCGLTRNEDDRNQALDVEHLKILKYKYEARV